MPPGPQEQQDRLKYLKANRSTDYYNKAKEATRPLQRRIERPQEMKYPIDNYDHENAPFVLFRQIEVQYDNESTGRVTRSRTYRNLNEAGSDQARAATIAQYQDQVRREREISTIRENSTYRAVTIPLDERVGMYIPVGFNIADSVNWETVETGLLGLGYEFFTSGNWEEKYDTFREVMGGGVLNNPSLRGLLEGHGDNAVAAALGSVAALLDSGSSKLPKLAKAAAGVLAAKTLSTPIFQELRRSHQAKLNPRQFMFFSGINMRSFSLDFNFVPTSEQESEMVLQIVNWFREGMYPELSAFKIAYVFPPAFLIEFHNVDSSYPKIPEVALTNASTTFNPNSMSYFERNGHPVEINLSLTFNEIQPIHKEMIKYAGY